MDDCKVTTVTLSDIGVALIILDQERRNKLAALRRTIDRISELERDRLRYAKELSDVEKSIAQLTTKNTYDTLYTTEGHIYER